MTEHVLWAGDRADRTRSTAHLSRPQRFSVTQSIYDRTHSIYNRKHSIYDPNCILCTILSGHIVRLHRFLVLSHTCCYESTHLINDRTHSINSIYCAYVPGVAGHIFCVRQNTFYIWSHSINTIERTHISPTPAMSGVMKTHILYMIEHILYIIQHIL